jgi:pyruvate kinase
VEAQAANSHRRTKIVATIGPATREVETMAELIRAGADVFRLNFSHGSQDEHAQNIARAREAASHAGREIALLGDLPGPKLRLGDLPGGVVDLIPETEVALTTGDGPPSPGTVPVAWEGLPEAVREDDTVYLADGRIRLRVLESGPGRVRCAVEAGGRVASHQGLNLPGAEVGLPSAGRKDLEWADFAVANGIDLLAISFVRRAEDIAPVERRIRTSGADVPVIAKIEKPQAAERAEEIVKATTAGIMVARGDLGIELPIEQVPGVQRHLLRLAGQHARPSITATQMLASMVSSPRPTRAEVSDVAAAILQGTDAVMLSEETAIGEHPAEAVAVMDRIARETEPDLRYGDWLYNRVATDASDVANSVARAAVGSTYTLGLAALVVPTRSGRTARLVSAHRPQVPVLAVSPRIECAARWPRSGRA